MNIRRVQVLFERCAIICYLLISAAMPLREKSPFIPLLFLILRCFASQRVVPAASFVSSLLLRALGVGPGAFRFLLRPFGKITA